MKKIMVVEDEQKISSLLEEYLQAAGYQTCVEAHGDRVVERFRREGADLLLLDLMLPGTDGLQICRQLRGFSQVPILMVTARVDEIDRLLGLEIGADDYICKPFSPREVVARVKAALRRIDAEPITDASLGLSLDEERLSATFGASKIELTPIEFALLKTLMSRPGKIFSRATLMDCIYQDGRVVSDRTVDSHVKKLRKKLQTMSLEHGFLESVYGAGYRVHLDL